MSPSSSPIQKFDRPSPHPLERRSPSSPARLKRSSLSQHRSISPYDQNYSSKERGNRSPVKVKSPRVRTSDERSYSRRGKAKETEARTVENNKGRKRHRRSDRSDTSSERRHRRLDRRDTYSERRHRRSDRRDTSSESEDSYDSELERKEARRRKEEEEERRCWKEKKRQRREEHGRKKGKRRAEKTKAKTLSDDCSDDGRAVREVCRPSDGAYEAEQRRLEVELRNKALEAFIARKGRRHNKSSE